MPLRYDQSTFFGLPEHRNVREMNIRGVLFGIASSLGTPNSGAENGPFFVRRVSKCYKSRFASEADVVDLRDRSSMLSGYVDGGDIFPDNDLPDLLSEVEQFVSELGAVPIAVGGDHSITFPIVRALHRKPGGVTKVVVFDHHLDVQCWGNGLDELYHTNVVSHLAYELGPNSVVHIGVNPFQGTEALRRHSLLDDLEDMGIQIPLFSCDKFSEDEILRAVGHGESVYVSVDVDVLQASEMTSTGYPSWVGLSFAELVRIFEIISRHNTIVGCDIVEFAAERSARDHQTLADAGRIGALAMHVLSALAPPQPMSSQRGSL